MLDLTQSPAIVLVYLVSPDLIFTAKIHYDNEKGCFSARLLYSTSLSQTECLFFCKYNLCLVERNNEYNDNQFHGMKKWCNYRSFTYCARRHTFTFLLCCFNCWFYPTIQTAQQRCTAEVFIITQPSDCFTTSTLALVKETLRTVFWQKGGGEIFACASERFILSHSANIIKLTYNVGLT